MHARDELEKLFDPDATYVGNAVIEDVADLLNQVKAEAQRELLARLAQEGQHRIKGSLLEEAEDWINAKENAA